MNDYFILPPLLGLAGSLWVTAGLVLLGTQ